MKIVDLALCLVARPRIVVKSAGIPVCAYCGKTKAVHKLGGPDDKVDRQGHL